MYSLQQMEWKPHMIKDVGCKSLEVVRINKKKNTFVKVITENKGTKSIIHGNWTSSKYMTDHSKNLGDLTTDRERSQMYLLREMFM